MSDSQFLENQIKTQAEIIAQFYDTNKDILKKSALATAFAISNGNKIFLYGVGLNKIIADYLFIILNNRLDRPPMPIINCSNLINIIDKGFLCDEKVFAALAKSEDVLIFFCNNDRQLISLLDIAKIKQMIIIGFTAIDNDNNAEIFDYRIVVPNKLIQEIYFSAANIFCSLVDFYLFESPAKIVEIIFSNNMEE